MGENKMNVTGNEFYAYICFYTLTYNTQVYFRLKTHYTRIISSLIVYVYIHTIFADYLFKRFVNVIPLRDNSKNVHHFWFSVK